METYNVDVILTKMGGENERLAFSVNTRAEILRTLADLAAHLGIELDSGEWLLHLKVERIGD